MTQLPAELIKYGKKELKKGIYECVLKIWEEDIIPQEKKYGLIFPIYKTGDVMMCDDYKAVTSHCTIYRILANILCVKLLTYAEKIVGE
jgi:hypothetical protein